MAIQQAKVILSIKELDYYIADLPIAEQLLLLARVSERLSKMGLSEPSPSPEKLEAERLEREKAAYELFGDLDEDEAIEEEDPNFIDSVRQMRHEHSEHLARVVSGQYD